MTESQIENAILRYLNTLPNCFAWRFHDQAQYRNGAYRKNPWEIRGVSDICLITSEPMTYWIEIKTPKGEQSTHQKKFQDKLNNLGHKYMVLRSVEECRKYFGRLKKTESTTKEMIIS